jgi:putative hydrolase of the HAD superfamily
LGLKLGILSNMPHDFLALARESLPIFRKTSVAVFSCEEGAIKPERPMYEKLIAVCGCRPEEIVFFDDVPVNVEAARALGIQAFVWKGAEDSRKRLEGLGLKV